MYFVVATPLQIICVCYSPFSRRESIACRISTLTRALILQAKKVWPCEINHNHLHNANKENMHMRNTQNFYVVTVHHAATPLFWTINRPGSIFIFRPDANCEIHTFPLIQTQRWPPAFMESISQERKSVVVLMGEFLRSITKEHFAVPPRRYMHYYYNMHKAMAYKRSKMTFLASVKSGVRSVTHASFSF